MAELKGDIVDVDYNTPADLFPSRRYAKSLARYRRFPTAAEAVRVAVESMPAPALVGTFLDIDGQLHEGQSIRALYHDAGFPPDQADADRRLRFGPRQLGRDRDHVGGVASS